MGGSDGWCSEWSDQTQGPGSRKDSKASYWLDHGVVSDASTEGINIASGAPLACCTSDNIIMVQLIPTKTRDRRGG